MATINPPAPLPLRNLRWRPNFPAQVNESGWTGRSKTIGLPGASYWTASGQLIPVRLQANMEPWRAFFTGLKGVINRFPLRAVEQQQTTAANPTVRTGATAGTSLPLQGLPGSATVLPKGAMLSVALPSGHQRLVCLQAALTTNGSGQATAVFDFELGEVPAVGAAVEIRWPFALMKMTNDWPGWDVAGGQEYGFSLECREAL